MTQAKVAMVIGLILTGIQFILYKRLIKYTTYLEKTFLGFLGFGTAWNSLKLWIMNYRFHPFRCNRNRTPNGLSPMELAAVDISNINWVEFSQRKFSSNKNEYAPNPYLPPPFIYVQKDS